MRGMSTTAYPTPYYGDSNTPVRMDIARPVDPITEHGTGKAVDDGYTLLGRRLRGDTPGDIVPIEEADRIEAAESAYNAGLNDF